MNESMNQSINQSINQKLYAMVLCLSVCLSQIGVQSTRLNESACFLVWTLFRPIIHCVIRKFRYLQNKVHLLGTLSQTSDLEYFATAYLSSKSVINFGGRSERDKLGRRSSTQLTIPTSSDARPLQFIAEIVNLCIQHDSVARSISDNTDICSPL